MKTVVFAYHNIGIAGLEAIRRNGFEIEAVFTHRDDPGEDCWFGSVHAWAKSNGIPVFRPQKINAARWIRKIRAMEPDVLFSFHYRHMLCGNILKIPTEGAYNLHASLLPAYRGRSPVNWVLIHGEKKTGVTLHHMVDKPDAGDIVGQKEVEIAQEDTALSLYRKLTAKTSELLDELLPLIRSGTAPRRRQDLKAGSYFGGRTPEDGKIDWAWPAQRVYNLIRAVTKPYPGAFTFLPGGEKMFIWWALPERADSAGGACGTIDVEENRVTVRAGKGKIRLMDIEISGRRFRDAAISDYFGTRKGLMLK
jgi:methionyl-tRNA formyltransferase